MFDINVSKREVRDSARLALQSAAAAAAMFILMQSIGLPEKFVGVLSAVLVVQPSVGGTLGEAWDRFAATLVGSALGIVCLIALPQGYGTAFALAFSMLVINAVAGFRPEWRYGVVAAVALALGSESDATQTAIDRSIAIGAGVVVGVVISLIVWPDTAAKRAGRHVRSALRASADRLDAAVGGALGEEEQEDKRARRRYHENIESARKAAAGVRFGNADKLRKQIEHVERLYNSALILDRVAEETDKAGGSTGDFRDKIDTLREKGCKIAKSIADGEAAENGDLEEIKILLGEVRDSVIKGPDDQAARDHIFANTLVFGLGEMVDSLEDLVEAFK